MTKKTKKEKMLCALLKKAIACSKEIPVGTNFLLKNLFAGEDWQKIPVGIRRQLGKKFREYINSNKIMNNYNNSANQCVYEG